DDQISREDGPVVPTLGPSPATAEVGPMQGMPRPAAGRRIEGPPVCGGQIDGLGQLPFLRTLHVRLPPGRTGPTIARHHHGCHPGRSLTTPPWSRATAPSRLPISETGDHTGDAIP